jgi:hypothetical protein
MHYNTVQGVITWLAPAVGGKELKFLKKLDGLLTVSWGSACTPEFLNSSHCVWPKIFHDRLKLEQCPFSVQPAAVPDQLPVGADHPVTRHNNRDRILPIRQTHSPRDIPHFIRLGFVGHGVTKRDIPKLVPYAKLKFRAIQKNRHIKVLQFPLKILVQLFDRLLKWIDFFLFRMFRNRGDIFIVDESQANKS